MLHEFLLPVGLLGTAYYLTSITAPSSAESLSMEIESSGWASTPGTAVPKPKSPYATPQQWVSAPIDPNTAGRPFQAIFGPNNDPRRHVLLSDGTRIPYSGLENQASTNLQWPTTLTNKSEANNWDGTPVSCSCNSKGARGNVGRGVDPAKSDFY